MPEPGQLPKHKLSSITGASVHANPTSDVTPPWPVRGMIVVSAGDVDIEFSDGSSVNFSSGSLILGNLYPFEVAKLKSGTAATVALLR